MDDTITFNPNAYARLDLERDLSLSTAADIEDVLEQLRRSLDRIGTVRPETVELRVSFELERTRVLMTAQVEEE